MYQYVYRYYVPVLPTSTPLVTSYAIITNPHTIRNV